MVKGFKDSNGKFRPTRKKGKSGKKKNVNVEIVSVTLTPNTIKKVKKKQISNINKGESNPSFSKAINQLVDQS